MHIKMNEKAIAALDELYRFFDCLNPKQREQRDKCVGTIRKALTSEQSAPVVDVNNIKLELEKKLNAARQTEKTERLQNGLSRTYDNYITGAMYAIDHLHTSGYLKTPSVQDIEALRVVPAQRLFNVDQASGFYAALDIISGKRKSEDFNRADPNNPSPPPVAIDLAAKQMAEALEIAIADVLVVSALYPDAYKRKSEMIPQWREALTAYHNAIAAQKGGA